MRQSKAEKRFSIFNYILLSLIGFITVYPLLYVLAASISSSDAVVTGKVLLIPKEITFVAYKNILKDPNIWIGYANSIFITVVGTAVNLFVTISAAYPLSKKRLPGLKGFTFFFLLSMWFTAGMIPFYLNLKDLHLLNTRIAVIIAFAMTPFNMLLLRTFFSSIPKSLEEAAKVDGASEFFILSKIYLPLSKAGLATIGLFYAVTRWNGYFWNMIILRDNSKIPLQVMLKKMIVEAKIAETVEGMDIATNYSAETIIYSTIVISVIPMLLIYPYVQKYFTEGVMLGAVKE
ncbi:MAG: carbohydrate ABC transporter permease [Vallitalea sp.]|jgi:putative aldouronate transport system permease protein|nr:carbohydrate ABC transporter permease [Vallitalea sp.]